MNDAVRENLLWHGILLLQKHGYHATGIQQIASAASIPKGSFCYYFPSKEAFALAAIARYTDGIESGILESLGRRRLRPLPRLRAYFESSLAAMQDAGFSHGCAIGNLLAEIGDTNGPLLQALQQAWERIRDGLEAFLVEAQDEEELSPTTDTRRLADLLLSGWEGALISMRAQQDTRPIEDFLRIMIPVLLSTEEGSANLGGYGTMAPDDSTTQRRSS